MNQSAVLQSIGKEIGLRFRDTVTRGEPVQKNFLTDDLAHRAVAFDGLQFAKPGGSGGGKVTVQRVRSLPMGTKEKLSTIGVLVWGEYEVQRLAVQEPPWVGERKGSPKGRRVRGEKNKHHPRRQR